ncbi:MAG: ABC transporter permease subunit [Pirellulales bacterium]|nr:ABC transporter permease subunit [Pirellulales bacterium]
MVNQLVLFADWTTWAKPLWVVALGAIAGVAILYVTLLILRLLLPRLSAICWGTAKEALSQPLFYVLLAFGAFAILFSSIIPYYTFGEDVKMVKELGLTIIMILSIILAVWTASVSVSEEIEGRTALTVLSKPIRRWHFILGKFAGILVPVALMFIILGALFLGTVSFKVVYDARESSQPEPSWQQCAMEMDKIVPGLSLAFMEAVVMASISVAISTRLAMLPNLVICGSIYALGHLVPTLVNSAVGQFEFVPFVANLLATILPMLDHFTIYGAISTGGLVSWQYVGWAGLYSFLYSILAMLVALLLFEDRDLA